MTDYLNHIATESSRFMNLIDPLVQFKLLYNVNIINSDLLF
jgi:hypothetical protein